MRKPVLMLGLTDYLQILRRRIWIVLACLVLGLAGATAIFWQMPKVYRSTTLILVESQKVPTDFIKPVTFDSIEERLISIQQQIFSRTLLQKIIEEFGLYKEELKSASSETIVEAMRKHIKVETVNDALRRNIQAFTIAYEGQNPATVMRVTNKLASLFIEENLRVREQLVEGTAEFLEQELQNIKEKLDLEEKQISEYKNKNMGHLPQQLEANLAKIDRLQMELQSANEALQITQERREILLEPNDDPTALTFTGSVQDPATASLGARLHQLRSLLVQLQAEYKDTYPDVIQTKRQIQELEAQLASGGFKETTAGETSGGSLPAGTEGSKIPRGRENGLSRNQTAQLRALDAEIQIRKKRKLVTEKQIKQFESRLEEVPIHEQKLSVLLRDYNNNRLNYEALLGKKLTAKISESMEKRQKGEQFRIIDPANLPSKPVKPDPFRIFVGGGAAGLAVAGALIWWKDLRNLPFRRPEEVEAALELPTLATIPFMAVLGDDEASSKSEERTKKQRLVQLVTVPIKMAKTAWSSFPWRRTASAKNRTPRVIQATRNAVAAEQFRVLAGRIIQMREKKGVRVLAVTSSLPGEGKSTLAIGLAVTLAGDYLEPTILMDGDMRNPSISGRIGLDDEKGLMNVLAGECDLESALFQHAHPTLKVLTAGTSDVDRLGLPGTRVQVQKLIDDLRHRGAFVILDGPPILPMADMNLYSEIVDSMLLVVRYGDTPQQVVIEALDFLAGGNIEGVILNGAMDLGRTYYANYAVSRYSTVAQSSMLYLPGGTAQAGASHEASYKSGSAK